MTFEHGKSTTVKTQKGLLRGFKYNDVYHFYGVKYAKGDYIAFDSKFEKLGGHRVKGKAFDNRVGVAILIELLKEEAEYDYYVSFNSFEEIGLKGAICFKRFSVNSCEV